MIFHSELIIILASTSYNLLKKCLKPQSHSSLCAMRILRQNIAAQKAQIMKNLELNNCDKRQLDEEIAKLEQLKKQYVNYEKDMQMQYNEDQLNYAEYCLSSDEGDMSSEDIIRGPFSEENSNSSEGHERRRTFTPISSDDNTITRSISYQSNGVLSRSSQLTLNENSEYKIVIVRIQTVKF